KNGDENLANVRARAIVNASRPWRRAKAIQLFEQARQAVTLPANEQYLLASLYEADRDWAKTHLILDALLARDRNNVQGVALYARCLIDEGSWAEASLRVNQLEELVPDRFETVKLKARILAGRKQGADVVTCLTDHARRQPRDLPQAARLLEELDQPEAAELLYRDYATREGPAEKVLPLAAFLGRHDRGPEAMRYCAQAWGHVNQPVVVVSTALEILSQANCSEADFERVLGWLKGLLAKDGQTSLLMTALANLHILHHNYGPAEDLLRRVIQADPANAEARNNLAWLLVSKEQPAPGEALSQIQQAITLEGSKADLLDTRAIVYLALHQPTKAVEDLKAAVKQKPALVLSFHLAQAEWEAGQKDAARRTLKDAQAAGLSANRLPRLERDSYNRFKEISKVKGNEKA
ncbi:MAG TPA: hypothetical protein VFA18_01260, partial [Gemmataceae bacterium]|nr:hypothetical protein [Gemmataceae bacterium]